MEKDISHCKNLVSVPAAPTYTQLGSGAGTSAGPASYSQPSVWPQWQQQTGGSDTGSQSSATGNPSSQTTAPARGGHSQTAGSTVTGSQAPATSQGTQEEFSHMLRMLDNSGPEFSDLSGMFDQFTE